MNLLDNSMASYVIKTDLTRKLTLDGETKAYPVYRVRLDALFYNDQNDRIATYISQYKSENGENAFRELNQKSYNDLIETFIIESNPAAIERTQNNIRLVDQREPGVVLADGRIIDGNRRYTCLRKLSKENEKFDWFETVILDMKLSSSKKQIKMLELVIQHGEEKKVDYNPIDRLVGVYQDIVKTGLLTVDEYAQSTNETVKEVNKRVEQANLLAEFLEYIHLPEQFHAAREYQVVDILSYLPTLMNKCNNYKDRESIKKIVFNNIMMKTTGDARKYARSLSSMIDNGMIKTYIKQQNGLAEQIDALIEENAPATQDELDQLVTDNVDIADELRGSFDMTLLKAKKRETKAKPSQIVNKSISMLRDVDTRVISTLNDFEREKLKEKIDKLSQMVSVIDEKTVIETESSESENILEAQPEKPKTYGRGVALRRKNKPMLICKDMNKPITALSFSLGFTLETALPGMDTNAEYKIVFTDNEGEAVSEIKQISISSGSDEKMGFVLNSQMSQSKECIMCVFYPDDEENVLMKIPFDISLSFSADFGV